MQRSQDNPPPLDLQAVRGRGQWEETSLTRDGSETTTTLDL